MTLQFLVDANPLISALLGGKAVNILANDHFEFHSTQHTLFEVEKYLPQLAAQLRRTELELFSTFQDLPVTAHQPVDYQDGLPQATQLIGNRDEKDVPILALTIVLDSPLWTNDRDFSGIKSIQVYSTAAMIKLFAQLT